VRLLLLLLTFVAFHTSAQVSLRYYLPTDVEYDPVIPTPESFFGFQVGEWHLTPEQIHGYLKVLDAASDRITMEPMGRTYEEREMWLLIITSPNNHKNIRALREQHLALSDPSTSSTIKTESMPVVVWMGYSVHGNEPSGSNASVLVAYHLAAARGARIEKQLKEAIILLNPSINPDGLNRFATWANMHKGRQPVADPASREHNEVWPGGRTNHYWFDLNRDWMPLQHPESKARLELYYQWRPNVLTDHHEMGTNTTFFFQPGVPSRNNPLAVRRTVELTEAIGRYHAKALDNIGSLYYTKEGYDDFYIGKGSSYPDLTGCIGILFEQASSRGHVQESIHGELTFPFTIRNQFTTSLSTLEAAVDLRKDLLEHQREFFASAVREAERSPIKGYIFGTRHDRARNQHLVDILLRHQIQVYELAREVRVKEKVFEPGKAFIVPTNQPHYRLLTSLFEQRTRFEDSLFYDISSWTLPYAFDIPFAEVRNPVHNLLGSRVSSSSFGRGMRQRHPSAYAFAFEWKEYYAPRALYRLLKENIKAKVATRPFEAMTASATKRFDYGTILLPLGIQTTAPAKLDSLLNVVAQLDGIDIYALPTGLSNDGIDLGSANFAPLRLPEVALIVGAGAGATDIGEVWHLLDQRMGMKVSLLETSSIGRTDVGRYNVLVMAGGSYATIESGGVEALKRWIEAGGTIIATEQAVEWIANNKIANATLRRDARRDSVTNPRFYADEERFTGALNMPGAIFQARYDRTHPLLFGFSDSVLSVFLASSLFLEPSTNPYATPVSFTKNPLLSGYLHPSYEKRLQNSAAVTVSAARNGRVILMTPNPVFRAFWFGTNKLLLNGIFFGSVIRSSSAHTDE